MAKYKIQVKRSAEKEIGKIAKNDLLKILDKIERLSVSLLNFMVASFPRSR